MEDERLRIFLEFMNRIKDADDEKAAYAAVTPGMPVSNITEK